MATPPLAESPDVGTDPRVLVLQNGARRSYAAPTVLAAVGMLDAFYTDAAASGPVERGLCSVKFLPLIGDRLGRLSSRRITATLAQRTTTFPVSIALDGVVDRLLGANPGGRFLGAQLLRRGLGQATMVYATLGWGRPLLAEARRRDIPVVNEFYVSPSITRVYRAERQAFPTWQDEGASPDNESLVGTAYDPCTVSDYIVAPADHVAEEVAVFHRFPRDRIAVVPYCVDDNYFQIQNRPTPGRVLFAGTCCLGKGIHYLAMAAERLATAGHRWEFRAAGHASRQVTQQKICRGLRFLGRLPRSSMSREYERADVFVLPTLSEGSAGVTYEALASGVPVITTRAAGSVVRDGVDGLIVPERNPEALAEAIAKIISDRPLRERMANAARQRARDYTWDRYGERLATALRQFNRH